MHTLELLRRSGGDGVAVARDAIILFTCMRTSNTII